MVQHLPVRQAALVDDVSLSDDSSQGCTSDQLRPSCRGRSSTVGSTNPFAIISFRVCPGTGLTWVTVVPLGVADLWLFFVWCTFDIVVLAKDSTAWR